MEWERTFFVNAAVDYISQWLEDTTRASWRTWRVDCSDDREGMYLTVQPARPAWPQQPPKVILEMEGHYTYPVEKTDEGLDVLESTWFFAVARFELLSVGAERTQVTVKCLHSAVSAHLEGLLSKMGEAWPENRKVAAASEAKQKREPSIRTQERARVYKELKDAHPEWSQARVAIEANYRLGEDIHTRDTVRNAYRAMRRAGFEGWEWVRADRIR